MVEITIKNDPNNYNYIVILGRQSQIVFFSVFLSVFNEINILCCVSVVKGFFWTWNHKLENGTALKRYVSFI